MEAVAVESCVLHKSHSPTNLTLEEHHVIPVAWQLLWQPTVAPFPGRDPDGRGELWDARMIPACPTGHRNVHHWIVAMMHSLDGTEDPAVARAGIKARGAQVDWALQALLRWKQAGGSLQQLVAAGEWGEA